MEDQRLMRLLRHQKDFDVFSFNSYGYEVNPNMIKRVFDLTGLPIVIGEFHFGVPGRGSFARIGSGCKPGGTGSWHILYYVEKAASNPAIIGTHWFQWMDQPATGRNDGENYNIGFVDVTDRPYGELTSSSKETFNRIFKIHSRIRSSNNQTGSNSIIISNKNSHNRII
ncbi:MAG: hypothetical protein MZW92_60565 [Comamonadaceae bacterium]|nr:hypothetical protein [Comamonadaceae bacterium]